MSTLSASGDGTASDHSDQRPIDQSSEQFNFTQDSQSPAAFPSGPLPEFGIPGMHVPFGTPQMLYGAPFPTSSHGRIPIHPVSHYIRHPVASRSFPQHGAPLPFAQTSSNWEVYSRRREIPHMYQGMPMPSTSTGAAVIPAANHPMVNTQSPNGQPSTTVPANGTGKLSRRKLKWEDWQVVVLIEVKRDKLVEDDDKEGTDRLEKSDTTWSKIARHMAARQVEAGSQQFKNKWDSLYAEYKSVRDYMGKSGSGNVFEMGRAERKKLNLPLKFHKDWFELMQSFLGDRANVNPACTAEAFDPLPLSEDDPAVEETTRAPTPAYLPDLPDTNEGVNHSETIINGNSGSRKRSANLPDTVERVHHSEVTSNSNSGIRKRKKSRGSKDNELSENMNIMSVEHLSVEKEKLAVFKETENIRVQVQKEQVEVQKQQVSYLREHSTNLSGALGLMAQSLDKIASSLQRPRER